MAGSPRTRREWTKDIILRVIEGWCQKHDYVFSLSLKDKSEQWLRSMFLVQSGAGGIGYGRELIYTGTARTYVIDDIKLMQNLRRKFHSGAAGVGESHVGATYTPRPNRPAKPAKAAKPPKEKRYWSAFELGLIKETVPQYGIDASRWPKANRLIGRTKKDIAEAATQMGVFIPEPDSTADRRLLAKIGASEPQAAREGSHRRPVVVDQDPFAGIKLQLSALEAAQAPVCETAFDKAGASEGMAADAPTNRPPAMEEVTPEAGDRNAQKTVSPDLADGGYDADAAASMLARKFGSRVKRLSKSQQLFPNYLSDSSET